ncbi:MAG: M56 family metallopeptidase [Lacipirellulaceae bacterium]
MTEKLSLIESLATQIWQVTLLAVLVFMLTRLLGNRLPRLSHGLWLLVLIKALTPPLWASPTGLFSWSPLGVITENPAGLGVGTVEAQALTLPAGVLQQRLPFGETAIMLAAVVYATGVLGVFTVWLYQRGRLRRTILDSQTPASIRLEGRLAHIAEAHGLRSAPKLIVTNADLGPAIIGTWRPWLILPARLVETLGEEELDAILAHEILHLQRRDHWLSALQIATLCLWWFHPMVWLASRKIEEYSERCVDRDVVGKSGFGAAKYASGLIQVLEQRYRLLRLSGMTGVRSTSITSDRLKSILNTSGKPEGKLANKTFAGLMLLSAILVLPSQPQYHSKGECIPAVRCGSHDNRSDRKNDIAATPSLEDAG